jgi:predicted  nucleic acid-binding Zn-ribbon protein
VSETIDDALRRLESVLSRLEGAVAQRFEAERDPSDLETELAVMSEDRARLAAELDAASARLVEVEATSADVGQRLGRAIAAVEGVLAPAHGCR